jgi:hypothetical protein
MVIQQKTKRPVQFELLEPARSSLLAWLERRGGSIESFAIHDRSGSALSVKQSGWQSVRLFA